MIEIRITQNEAEQRIDRFLRKYLKEYKLGDIYKLFRKNKVKINKKKVKENYMLCQDDIVQLYIANVENKEVRHNDVIQYNNNPVDIIYEDDNLLLINKSIGLLTHPDSPKDKDTLISRALGYLYKNDKSFIESPTFKPAVCNRLDRNTGGIVIVAKNYPTLKLINKMIRQHDISKKYKCIVGGKIASAGEIRGFLQKDEINNVVSVSNSEKANSKPIHTKYSVNNNNNHYSLLDVEIITGKSHQIRASFASINHPLIGDSKYGDRNINNEMKQKYNLKHQFLYAYSIEFCKCDEQLEYLQNKIITCNLPEHLIKIEKDLFT